MAKVGFIHRDIKDKYDVPYRGEGRYISHIAQTLSEVAEVEFIPLFKNGYWDLLVFQSRATLNITSADVEKWLPDVCRKTWFQGWTTTGFVYQFDRGILWNPVPLYRETCGIHGIGYKKWMLWYPPIESISAGKKNKVIFNLNFPNQNNIQLASLADELYYHFNLELIITRKDLAAIEYQEYLNSVKRPYVEHYFSKPYSEFQQMLAEAMIVIGLHRGPSMVPMESFVHGTPCLTYAHQEAYLEPDYGFNVHEWQSGDDKAGKILKNEVYSIIKRLVISLSDNVGKSSFYMPEDDIIQQHQRTVQRMRELSNPERQKAKLIQAFEEDMND